MYLLCSLNFALFSLFVSQVFLQWSSCAHDCKMKGEGGGVLHQRYHYFSTTTVEDQRGASLRSPGPPPHSLFPSLSLSTLHFSSLSFEVVLTHTLTLYWRDRRSGDLRRGRSKVTWEESRGPHAEHMRLFKVSSGPLYFYFLFLCRSVFICHDVTECGQLECEGHLNLCDTCTVYKAIRSSVIVFTCNHHFIHVWKLFCFFFCLFFFLV